MFVYGCIYVVYVVFWAFVGVAINVFVLVVVGAGERVVFVMACLSVLGFVVIKTSVLYIEKPLYKTDVFYNHIT